MLLKIGMYTVYLFSDMLHKDISNSFGNRDQKSAYVFPKFAINLWDRGKKKAPTIAFPVTTEYVHYPLMFF